jgi:flavin-dependent dehydrogenase
VKEPTVALAEALDRDPVLYQGNWIPHRLRDATEDGVFFAGDSAGHCLPLTAEGIRTAFYFGIELGRELRKVLEGRSTREHALREYSDFSARHKRQFTGFLFAQRLIPRIPPRLLTLTLRGISTRPVTHWAFGRYLDVAPPSYALPAPAANRPLPEQALAA